MSPAPRRALVIGGGISGLATAALLAREGLEVDLVESRAELGGRAGSWEHRGFRFDTGPSWYLMPEVFDHFFRLLGTSSAEQLDLRRLDPGYRVFFEGAQGPLDIHASAARNAEVFEQIEPGAGRRLDEYLDSAARTYDEALEHFLYTSFTSPRPFLTPAVAAQSPRLLRLLTESLEHFAARHVADPRLRQVLGYPAVFLGSSPDRTPAMYHLMSALDLTGGVQYPMGGFAHLIEVIAQLALAHGVRIHRCTRARRIVTAPRGRDRRAAAAGRGAAGSSRRAVGAGRRAVAADRRAAGPGRRAVGGRRRARVRGAEVTGPDGSSRLMSADLVVGAADLHHLETTMLPRALQTFPETWWRGRTPGPGAVLALLGIEGELPQLPHHSLLFTRDWHRNFADLRDGTVPSPASAYVCRPSATDPAVAPAGHENLFMLVPVPSDPGLGRGGVDGAGDEAIERIADDAIAQLAAQAAVPDLPRRIVVRRTLGPAQFQQDLAAWRGSMLGPAHTVGQSAFFRASNASRHVENLLYAGSSTIPGIGLPMCLISAELVVKRLRGDTSTSPLPEPFAEVDT